jgi:cytochrome c oxidase subunit IV
MRARLVSLFGAYVLLLALLAVEYFAAFLPLHGAARFLLLLPALAMVWVIATGFMGLRREGAPVLMFAASAVLWLSILLGLGLIDPLTRATFATGQGADSTSRRAP